MGDEVEDLPADSTNLKPGGAAVSDYGIQFVAGSETYPTIQAAINACTTGYISIKPGVYTENINFPLSEFAWFVDATGASIIGTVTFGLSSVVTITGGYWQQLTASEYIVVVDNSSTIVFNRSRFYSPNDAMAINVVSNDLTLNDCVISFDNDAIFIRDNVLVTINRTRFNASGMGSGYGLAIQGSNSTIAVNDVLFNSNTSIRCNSPENNGSYLNAKGSTLGSFSPNLNTVATGCVFNSITSDAQYYTCTFTDCQIDAVDIFGNQTSDVHSFIGCSISSYITVETPAGVIIVNCIIGQLSAYTAGTTLTGSYLISSADIYCYDVANISGNKFAGGMSITNAGGSDVYIKNNQFNGTVAVYPGTYVQIYFMSCCFTGAVTVLSALASFDSCTFHYNGAPLVASGDIFLTVHSCTFSLYGDTDAIIYLLPNGSVVNAKIIKCTLLSAAFGIPGGSATANGIQVQNGSGVGHLYVYQNNFMYNVTAIVNNNASGNVIVHHASNTLAPSGTGYLGVPDSIDDATAIAF